MTPPEALAFARQHLGPLWAVRWHGTERELSARRGDVAVFAKDPVALIERAGRVAS